MVTVRYCWFPLLVWTPFASHLFSSSHSIHLISSCSLSQNISSHIHQVFFLNSFTIPNISLQSAILCFIEEIQDQHNVFIKCILLIYKHYIYLSKNFKSMNFIGPKYYILETKTVEERVAQNDPHKMHNLFKKDRLSAICYTEINFNTIQDGCGRKVPLPVFACNFYKCRN